MNKEVSAALFALEQQLTASKIDRWEMLYVPVGISFRAGLTPERLEQLYRYKLVIRHVHEATPQATPHSEIAQFLKSMKASTFTPSSLQGDMRWGLRFYSQDNTTAFSMYVSQLLVTVLVAGKSYQVEGPIKGWFTSFAKHHFEPRR